MAEEENRLILEVEKPLWLSIGEGPIFKVKGWTTIKPKRDNGFLEKGTLLIFDYIYTGPEGEEGLNFIAIKPGLIHEQKPEFDQKEIESLINEGALKPYLVWTEIDEMTIAQGNVFIKYPKKISFHDQFFVPKDIYIVMGKDENNKSMGKLRIGEKVSLKDIIDLYARSIYQRKR